MSQVDATSWTLIRRAAAGNPADKESFARRYGPVLRAYLAARFRSPAERDRIDDCTQEIFVQCFKADGALLRADPSREGGFRAFLYGVARNVAAMAERTARQRQGRELPAASGFDLDQVAGDDASLSQVFDRAWAVMVTREARELLAGRAGTAPWLRALEHRFSDRLPPRDIAARLGADVKQVYEMLRKAKHEYRVALLEVMASYHPDSTERELERKCVEMLGSL